MAGRRWSPERRARFYAKKELQENPPTPSLPTAKLSVAQQVQSIVRFADIFKQATDGLLDAARQLRDTLGFGGENVPSDER